MNQAGMKPFPGTLALYPGYISKRKYCQNTMNGDTIDTIVYIPIKILFARESKLPFVVQKDARIAASLV